MDEMTKIKCPKCGREIFVPPSVAGGIRNHINRISCIDCNKPMQIKDDPTSDAQKRAETDRSKMPTLR